MPKKKSTPPRELIDFALLRRKLGLPPEANLEQIEHALWRYANRPGADGALVFHAARSLADVEAAQREIDGYEVDRLVRTHPQWLAGFRRAQAKRDSAKDWQDKIHKKALRLIRNPKLTDTGIGAQLAKDAGRSADRVARHVKTLRSKSPPKK